MATINEFRAEVANRDFQAASRLASVVVSVMGNETPAEVFDFLDSASTTCRHTAFVCATSFFHREEPAPGHRVTLFKRVVRGHDDDLSAAAYFALAGECLLDKKTVNKTMGYLKHAAELGHSEATLRLAIGYDLGIFGNRVNVARALESFADAVDDDYPPAKLAMAEFLIRRGIDDTVYDPIELIREAEDDDIEGASELLAILRQAGYPGTETEEEDLPLLAERVIPADLSRPRLVVEALRNETDVSHEQASILVSALHGFPEWEDLETAVNTSGSAGPFDEELSRKRLRDRQMDQADIIQAFFGITYEEAEVFQELLKPTARGGLPSLRALSKTISERLPED